MQKKLIIVESPAKVKTIKKFLGSEFEIQASIGHVRDLPKSSIGVDEDKNFTPHYEIIPGKEKIVKDLQTAAEKAQTVYLAPDPDREGEAIAWHIAQLLRDKNPRICRIEFNEITAHAVLEALRSPRTLNENLFDAQQARRILDRLVGYKISPLLWKVRRGISAGRVQSVALRLLVDREDQRYAFVPEEFWILKVTLAGKTPPPFTAELWKVNDKTAHIPNAETADAIESEIKNKPARVQSIQEKERSRVPLPPFITSTLQQTANQRLGYTAKHTMAVAQKLYEGLDLGREKGTAALITYMRTDSVRIAKEAQAAAATFIETNFGKDYLAPGRTRQFRTKDSAQDAHEAIRPVDVTVTPDSVKEYLAPDQYQVYRLIWIRFLASQMAAARFHDTTVTVACGITLWRAKGETLLFPGFLAVYPASKNEDITALPKLAENDLLTMMKLSKDQKFTQPEPRFTEASLVRELEQLGIGRPSTYAAIISTLQDRNYALLQDKHFVPTDLGRIVCKHLCTNFTTLMDVSFTAHMEKSLDQVADGTQNWITLLQNFTHDFNPALAAAAQTMRNASSAVPTDIKCPKCGNPLVIKFGKAGNFLACSAYPQCKFTSDYTRDEHGILHLQEKLEQKAGICPNCGGDLIIRKSHLGGRFIACSNYPKCTYTQSLPTGVHCPQKDCDGMLVEKTSKRGKTFYACSSYPKCTFVLWDKPVPKKCPRCGSPFLLEKKSRTKGSRLICPNPQCHYASSTDAQEENSNNDFDYSLIQDTKN